VIKIKKKYGYVTTAADVAKRSDCVSLSLPSEKVTNDVIFGPEGLLVGFSKFSPEDPPPIIIDHGTSTRNFVRDNSLKVLQAGAIYVDAPVSGGPGGALAGTLTVMIGGEEKTVKIITPFLECFGNNILHFGPIGSGMGAKLVNQALVGMHVQASVEALHMAGCLGLTDSPEDTQRLLDMLSVSWGQSKVLEGTFADYIKAQRHPKGFESVLTTQSPAPLRNLNKDFACIQAEILKSDKVFLPVTNITSQSIERACNEKGLADASFVSLIELLRKQA